MTDTPRTGDQKRLGILLAGGRSRRFGRDKVLASLAEGSETLLSRALDLFRPHVQGCLLVRSQDCPALPEDVIQVVDPQEGPLRALRVALDLPVARAADWCWIAPCDMPFLQADLYQQLERRAWGRAGACYRGSHGLEPLVSVLTAEGARRLREWSDPSAPLRRIFETLDVALVDCDPAPMEPSVAESSSADAFLNVNTTQDWQVAREALALGMVDPPAAEHVLEVDR